MLKKLNFLNLILAASAFFPFWIVIENEVQIIRMEIYLSYIAIVLLFYTAMVLIKNNNFLLIEKIFISFLIFYGLDINFGFWLIFDQIFNIRIFNYILSLIFASIISYLIFKFLNKKKNKIFFLVIIIGLTFYNAGALILLNNKTEQDFNFTKIDQLQTKKEKKKLIIFLDEMVGYGAINLKSKYGKKAIESYENTFINNGFQLYKNAFSIYPNTVQSIPHSLNFSYKKENNTNKFSNENYFDRKSKWFVKENKFFEQNESILTNKSLGLDFCRNKNVNKCVVLNAKILEKQFIKGFNPNKKEYFFNKLLKSNSIIMRYIWRVFYSFNFFDKNTDFTYQKAYFEKNLDNIFKIVSESDYKINLFHLLVPHRPFGFKLINDKECVFDVTRSKINSGKNKKINQNYLNEYYQEVICTNIFLNNFFQRLKKNNIFESLDILIMSDTGVGLTTKKKMYEYLSAYSVLFAIKTDKDIDQNKEEIISSQYLFSKYLDKNFVNKKLMKENFIFDNYKKEFIVFDDFEELIGF
jgi:hypothetical protein